MRDDSVRIVGDPEVGTVRRRYCRNERHRRLAVRIEDGIDIYQAEYRKVTDRPAYSPRLGFAFDRMEPMVLDDYKVVLYRNQPAGWVAEVPSIPGCHALMPTREAALMELSAVFQMISEEYAERNETLPADTTEIVHA